MPNQLFQYPLPGSTDLSDLNAYLASHRVVNVQQHVVTVVGGATLVFVVQTAGTVLPLPCTGESGRKIDYRAEMSPQDFAIYSRLREERKRIAEEEGVPVYTVFTNEQLAAMVRSKVGSIAEVGRIEGIGKARLEKHGDRMLALLEPLRLTATPSTPQPSP